MISIESCFQLGRTYLATARNWYLKLQFESLYNLAESPSLANSATLDEIRSDLVYKAGILFLPNFKGVGGWVLFVPSRFQCQRICCTSRISCFTLPPPDFPHVPGGFMSKHVPLAGFSSITFYPLD